MFSNRQTLSACTSILVGKKATADGSTMIGRNEDCRSAWPKHMTVHPHQEGIENNHYSSPDKDNDFEIIIFVRRRSEEHTSELQSRFDIVCRLLLEKKNNFCSIVVVLN